MTCTNIGNAIICTGGPDYKILDSKGKVWRFEMHHYCGPIVLTRKTGEVMDPQPVSSSPFWECVSFWAQQGQQLDALGHCVWQRPKPIKLQRINGRNYLLEGE